MKKELLFALFAATVSQVGAQTRFKTSDGLEFQVLTESTVSVYSGSGYEGTSLVIPSTVENEGVTYAVTAIEAKAFKGHAVLCEVTVPESVETIGDSAFYGCSALAVLQLPAVAPSAPIDVALDLRSAGCNLQVPDGAAAAYKSAWPWALYYGQPGVATEFTATLIDVWEGEHTVTMTDGLTLQMGNSGECDIVDLYTGDTIYTVSAMRMVFQGAKVPDAVHDIESGGKIHFAFTPNGIIAEGLPQGTLVTAYTVDGKRLFADRATGRCIIPRSSLSHGIVIIKAGNETLKIMNR